MRLRIILTSLLLAAPLRPIAAQPTASPSAEALLRALAADPVTAPYAFTARVDRGRVVLAGRVGTRAVYDRAVRIAIASDIPFTDRLVIDTAEVTRAAVRAAAGAAPRAMPLSGVAPYVYPQPLFGYYDDPFDGFEPPVISYPPWWQPRVEGAPSAMNPAPPAPPVPATGETAVELSIDPLGYGLLRGTVATQAEKDGLAARAARLPGITGIINRIEVADTNADAALRPGDAGAVPPPPEPAPDDQPPPPPRPYDPQRDGPAAARPMPPAPASGSTIHVATSGETVTLTGHAPSVLEAMRAFRAAQRTAGITRIVDRIEFPLPAAAASNPLLGASADDLQPYLQYHLGRQLGSSGTVDSVEVQGHNVTLGVTLNRPEDRERVEAILRSAPLLRGFTTRAEFQVR